jgi:hypothetical protein
MAEWVRRAISRKTARPWALRIWAGLREWQYPMMISAVGTEFHDELTGFDWGIFLFPGNQYNPLW